MLACTQCKKELKNDFLSDKLVRYIYIYILNLNIGNYNLFVIYSNEKQRPFCDADCFTQFADEHDDDDDDDDNNNKQVDIFVISNLLENN